MHDPRRQSAHARSASAFPPGSLHAAGTQIPGKTLQYLEQSIAHWVMSHGALVFMVPTIESGGGGSSGAISVSSYVRELDGLILQGGADMAPKPTAKPLRDEWAATAFATLARIELFWEFVIRASPCWESVAVAS